MKQIIYADNAATTKMDQIVFEAMSPWLLGEYGNASQMYSFSVNAKKALKESREMIASCINASPDEIYFTSGGTESDNWAIKGYVDNRNLRKTYITSEIEHHAVLNSMKSLSRFGCLVKYLPVDSFGLVSVDELKKLIDKKTMLVSIMAANNEIGTIEPIKELSDIAHTNGSLFHTDAVQAIGHIPINVHDLNIDLLSASAHKFNGPKGIGFLFIKRGTEINSFNDGGKQEFGKRAGTENVAGVVGMARALKINCDNMHNNKEHILHLENLLIKLLHSNNLDFIRNGSDNHLPGNISLSFKDMEGEMLLHRLDLMGICVSTGSACNSSSTEISHVINAIRTDERYSKGTIRISLGKDNTENDIYIIADSINKIINLK